MSRSTKRLETIKKKYGEDYFKIIGKKGGANSNFRPFRDPEIASAAGKKSKGGGRPKKVLDPANNTSV